MLDEFEGEARYGLRRELDLDHILAESDLFAPDPAVDDETVGARLFDPDVDIRDSERNREQLVLRYGRSAEHFASRVDRLDEVAAMDVPPAVCVQLPAAIVVDEDSAEKWAIEAFCLREVGHREMNVVEAFEVHAVASPFFRLTFVRCNAAVPSASFPSMRRRIRVRQRLAGESLRRLESRDRSGTSVTWRKGVRSAFAFAQSLAS